MGIFSGIKSNFCKASAAASIQSFFDRQKNFGLMPFDIKTADLASKLVDVTWEKELLIDGKSIKDRGIYPQKLAFAATSLMVGSKIYKGTEYNDVHHMCLIGIGEILITIEQKLNSFKFGSYDMYLLKNAYNFYFENESENARQFNFLNNY